jgi:hypothetical protein
MTSSRRLLASVGIALAVVTSAPVVLAQSTPPTAQELETARTLYKEGKELRAAGDLRGAVEKLQAAHALGHTPVTGIELAKTYVLVGKLVEAREVALSIARLGVASDETEKSADARAEGGKLAEELRPRIPTLAVKIRGLSPGELAHVVIDGVMVPDAAITEPQKVDPGKHEVLVRVGEGAAARETRASADTPEAQAIEIAVDVPPAPPGAALPLPPPEPPTPGESHGTPALAKLAFGATVAGTVVGVVGGVMALSFESQLSGECPGNRCLAGSSGAGDLSSAHTWASVSTVSFVIAGAGLVTGVIDMLVEQGRREPTTDAVRISPWIGTGMAGVHGEF